MTVDDRVILEIGKSVLRACIAEQKLENALAEIDRLKVLLSGKA